MARRIPIDGAVLMLQDLRAVAVADPDPDDSGELDRVDFALWTLEQRG